MNTAAPQTFRAETGLTSFADILTHSDILRDPHLSTVFSSAPCSVCEANDLPTEGPTFFDRETGGQFCLLCLELSGEPLPDSGEEPDPLIVAMATEIIAARRAV